MIWAPGWDGTIRRDAAIVSHITSEIQAVCDGNVPLSEEQLLELARAVACYVEQECGTQFTDSRSLVMLASRALDSLGESRVARKLLVFGSGLVQPSEWEVSGSDDMWVLDLRRMTVQQGAALELVFFNSLRLVIESMADVWDETGGAGVLGLRHVTRTAALLGGISDTEKAARIAEIKESSVAVLDRLRAERSWERAPMVMDLDL